MRAEAGVTADAQPRAHATASRFRRGRAAWSRAYDRVLQRCAATVAQFHPPRGVGIAASVVLVIAALGYGVVRGGHLAEVVDQLKDTRDAIANTVGFRIAAIALSGQKEVSREEVLTTTGVTGRSSLLFLDVDAARERLKTNPWIADAQVLKLYPDHLQITITERQPFALWQKDGRVSVIAADGTVLEPFVAGRYFGLPLVVGRGAQLQAKEFITVLNKYPDVRSVLRASILVADRRWNLRLKNGIDVRLPETNVEQALDTLVSLDRDKKLLSRDIVAVDLRFPDRVTVRLSDEAAQARADALKEKTKKKGGAA
jgi:cell division protein FtsQ